MSVHRIQGGARGDTGADRESGGGGGGDGGRQVEGGKRGAGAVVNLKHLMVDLHVS